MRKHYLDNIRWFAVVIVVIYHVFYMFNAEGILGGVGKITNLDVQYYDLFQYITYPWMMLLLFIVSGISSRLYFSPRQDGTIHSEKDFIKSRTVKLLVPSTIGLFAFQFIQGFINASISGVFHSEEMSSAPIIAKAIVCILSGIGVLWYIQILWIFSLVLALVRILEKGKFWNVCSKMNPNSKASTAITLVILIAVVVLFWGAAQILNTPIIVVYRFGLYGLAFFAGYFVFSQDGVIEILKKWFWLFLIAAVALGTTFCILYFGQNYAEKPLNRSPIFVGYGYFASISIIALFARFFDYENAFTRWMTKRSWGLYVFHYLGISAVALYLGKTALVPPAVAYILALIAGFGGGYALNEIISRIPFWRWAVLGISKKKKIEKIKAVSENN